MIRIGSIDEPHAHAGRGEHDVPFVVRPRVAMDDHLPQ